MWTAAERGGCENDPSGDPLGGASDTLGDRPQCARAPGGTHPQPDTVFWGGKTPIGIYIGKLPPQTPKPGPDHVLCPKSPFSPSDENPKAVSQGTEAGCLQKSGTGNLWNQQRKTQTKMLSANFCPATSGSGTTFETKTDILFQTGEISPSVDRLQLSLFIEALH